MKTNLSAIDFNALYKEQRAASGARDKTPQDWDKKAPEMNERVLKSSYNADFLRCLDLSGCETLIDAGCGVGNLTREFAPHMKKIYAFDSSSAMLDLARKNCQDLSSVEFFSRDLSGEWNLPKADLVVASRSLGVCDLAAALQKVHTHALKKCAVSFVAGAGFANQKMLEAIGKSPRAPRPDYIYALNILHAMGIYARVSFVKTKIAKEFFDDFDDFLAHAQWHADALTNEERARLEHYYAGLESVGGKKYQNADISWAVLTWEK